MKRIFGMVRPALEGSLHRRFLVFATLTSLALALGAGACSNQGEGERCDLKDGNNGSDDCRSPLVCTATSIYSGGASAAGAICCPQSGCQTGSAAGVGLSDLDGGETAVDASDGASRDASADSDASSTDAASDSPLGNPDAAADAPADSAVD